MDLDGIIRELLDERKRLDRMIRTLEQHGPGDGPPMKRSKSRRGRKSMDSAARQQVSERMKQYWARRREERGTSGDDDAVPESVITNAA